jgi:dimethylhistidine N-methyltransferase
MTFLTDPAAPAAVHRTVVSDCPGNSGRVKRALVDDVRQGLGERPLTLPSKWLYDARGSELFEQITLLPEYYPTRAEAEILTARAGQIAASCRAHTLVELGSGSSRKTRLLLDALTAAGTLRRYTPLDVSQEALQEAASAISAGYPGIAVDGLVGDFEDSLPPQNGGPQLVAFLGSTLGNFDVPQRTAFLAGLARALRPGDVLLLGVDLVKSPAVLVPAYDDAAGITAAFNRNVLHVLNRELRADFDTSCFDHHAVWDGQFERIEMRLRARTAQTVTLPLADLVLDLHAGEEIRTELSTKFRREALTAELHDCGLAVRDWWTDGADRYALLTAVIR